MEEDTAEVRAYGHVKISYHAPCSCAKRIEYDAHHAYGASIASIILTVLMARV